MDVYYENSKNQRVYFTQIPYVLLDGGSIFNYSLSYATTSGKEKPRIKNFSNNLKKGDMTIIVSGKTREEYCENINSLMDIIAYDVNNNTSGKLYCGEQYCSGYFYENKHGTTYNNSRRAELKLNFIAENGKWIKETAYSFEAKALSLSNVKKYAYKYPYRYSISAGENFIDNSHYADCNFKLRIYGPCVNPHIIIGTHRYQVWTILTAGEWLEIDSIRNKVYKVMVNGTKVSLFNERDKLSSVFDKIPPGRQRVAAPGTFNFDLILYEERSEPEWS